MTRRRTSAWCAVVLAVVTAVPAGAVPPAPSPSPVDGIVPDERPDAPDLEPPVALLLDADTGQVLVEQGAVDEPVFVASTVKALTALAARDAVDLADVVVVGDEVQGTVGSNVELEPGERWTVRQLMEGLLVRSGNDAAVALAVHIDGDVASFVERMRDTARAIGIELGPDASRIENPTGLDDVNLLSPRDLALIGRAVLDDDELRTIAGLEEATLPGVGTDVNRNLLVGGYPGATGIKTGFTSGSGNVLLASAERGGRELVAVVLGAGADPERFEAAARLLDHGFGAWERVGVTGQARGLVAGGELTYAVPELVLNVPVDSDAALDLTLPAQLPVTLTVPVLVGDEVVTTTDAAVVDGRAEVDSDAAAIGRGVVDGVHAALRAARYGQPAGRTG